MNAPHRLDWGDKRGHILLVVDRSGSMAEIRSDAVGGIRSFFDAQRELPMKITVSLAQFDNEFEWVQRGTPLADFDAHSYDLVPRGSTALLDAVGRALTEDAEHVFADGHKADRTAVVIVTDGIENASREWSQEAVKDLIAKRKADGVEVVFLATDITTVDMARRTGAHGTQTVGTGAGTRSAYGVTGQSVSAYMMGETRSVEVPDHIGEEGSP